MHRLKAVTAVLCIIAAASAISTYASARQRFGFLLYEQQTQAWNIHLGTTYLQEPQTIQLAAESNSKRNERVIYKLEIRGPRGFSNKDLTLSWADSDGRSYTIGHGGSQSFKGTTTLKWQSATVIFKAKQTINITLVLTFSATAQPGQYSAKLWIEYR